MGALQGVEDEKEVGKDARKRVGRKEVKKNDQVGIRCLGDSEFLSLLLNKTSGAGENKVVLTGLQ